MKLITKLIRFGFVGGLAFLIDYSLLFVLKSMLNVDVYIASTCSFVVSLKVNYILSMKYVFVAKEGLTVKKQVFVFFVTAIIGLGINQLIMWILIEFFNVYYMISKLVATVVVMVWNFISRCILLEDKK